MPWEAVNVEQRRVEFVVKAGQGKQTMTALCREFGICRATGYKWLHRWKDDRLEGFREHSRRPKTSPTRTAEWKQQLVVALRKRYPDWGAKKLAYRLKVETGIEMPRITLHRILMREGLVRREERHAAATKRFRRKAPNELWQMDFKGMPEPWTNRQSPLSIVDDHSRYVVALEWQQGLNTEAAHKTVRAVFERSGVPRQMLLDHGTPWWNMASGIGLTRFSVWLMKQGIQLLFSGYRHPQTQGKVERFHGSLERALKLRGAPEEAAWQHWLAAYRREFNEDRPHEALGMEPPAKHWQPSEKAYQPQPREWEYGDGFEVRRLDSKGQTFIAGKRLIVAGALAGERVGLQDIDGITLISYRATLVRLLDRRSGKAAMAALPEQFRWASEDPANPKPVYDVMKHDCLPCLET